MTKLQDMTNEQLRREWETHSALARSYHESFEAAKRRSKMCKAEMLHRYNQEILRLSKRGQKHA